MDRKSSEPNARSSGGAGTGDSFRRLRPPEPGWLADALAELAEVDDEIAEDNLCADAKAEAERIVRALARRAPTRALLAVYPTEEAEIALHFKAPGRADAVLVLLRDDGRTDCYAYVGGRSRRAHYNTSADLPDAFVLEQLDRLMPGRVEPVAWNAGVGHPRERSRRRPAAGVANARSDANEPSRSRQAGKGHEGKTRSEFRAPGSSGRVGDSTAAVPFAKSKRGLESQSFPIQK